MGEVRKCPKCGRKMVKTRRLISYTDISLGDMITSLYCKSCGYTEVHIERKELL